MDLSWAGVRIEFLEAPSHLMPESRVGADATSKDHPAATGLRYRPEGLGHQYVDGGLLKRCSDMRYVLVHILTHGTSYVDDRRLQAAEREVIEGRVLDGLTPAKHRSRQAVTTQVTCCGDPLDGRATRVRKAEQFRDLVESLSRGVVTRLSEQPVFSPLRGMEKQGVST